MQGLQLNNLIRDDVSSVLYQNPKRASHWLRHFSAAQAQGKVGQHEKGTPLDPPELTMDGALQTTTKGCYDDS